MQVTMEESGIPKACRGNVWFREQLPKVPAAEAAADTLLNVLLQDLPEYCSLPGIAPERVQR